MKLVKIYPELKKSIVAFIPKYSILQGNKKPAFPPILGTGFFVNDFGLIATNDHVVESFTEIKRPKNMRDEDFGISAVLYYQSEGKVRDIIFDIKRIIRLSSKRRPNYKRPDLAFIEVNLRGNPYMKLEETASGLKEGTEVATSGFPTGRFSLMGPEGYFQISPTLQRGIISAILPYPKKRPDAFAVNVMTHGGASGSPVFSTETGRVFGILFSVLRDASYSDQNKGYIVPTNISYAIPSHLIHSALEEIDENMIKDKTKDLFSDLLKKK